MEIGQRLTRYRELAGWTHDELATRAGVSRPTVTRIESGSLENPTINVLRGLAKALGIRVAQLIGEDARRPTPHALVRA